MAKIPEIIAVNPANKVTKGCTCVSVKDAAVKLIPVLTSALLLSCVITILLLFL